MLKLNTDLVAPTGPEFNLQLNKFRMPCDRSYPKLSTLFTRDLTLWTDHLYVIRSRVFDKIVDPYGPILIRNQG